MKGTVKRMVADKNFGFISPEGADRDIFFHATELNGVRYNELNIGDIVEFELVESEKGPKATSVRKATS